MFESLSSSSHCHGYLPLRTLAATEPITPLVTAIDSIHDIRISSFGRSLSPIGFSASPMALNQFPISFVCPANPDENSRTLPSFHVTDLNMNWSPVFSVLSQNRSEEHT